MILRLPDSNTRNLFVAHLESNNMSISDFNVVLEIDNMATIKDLIRRDFGVSILARSVCLDELKKGKIAVLPVENLSMMREINIAYHNDFTQFDVLHDIMKVYNETLTEKIPPSAGFDLIFYFTTTLPSPSMSRSSCTRARWITQRAASRFCSRSQNITICCSPGNIVSSSSIRCSRGSALAGSLTHSF